MMAGEGARATFMTETGVGGGAGRPRASRRAAAPASAPAADGSSSNPMSELSRLHSLPAEQRRSARDKARAALEALLAMSAEQYVELAFEAASQMNFEFTEHAEKAAYAYDVRHKVATAAAREHLVQLEVTPTDLGVQKEFDDSVRTVRRNRYFIPESAGSYRAIKPRRRRKPRWRLETSCWAVRLTEGNSKDFFETPEAMRRLFMADWDVARRSHELTWTIVKAGHDPANWKNLDKASALKGGEFDEVDEVQAVLWQHYRMVYGAFDYYAVLFSENENAPGEPDVFNISLNAYMAFCEQCHMISKKVPHGEFETIWALVNATDKVTGAEDKHNKGKFLNRQEFFQCLVRCAMLVYIKRGSRGDVSDALSQLLSINLSINLPPFAMQNSDAFRRRMCYIEKTSVVLEANLGSIRTLYEHYAEVSHEQGDAFKDDALMSIGEWMTFCHHVGLIESRQLSVPQCKYIFIWSRIRSIKDLSDREETRLRHLFPVDFLEALVRMATMLALPTDEEIEEVGAKDAGDFLLAMQVDSPHTYNTFLESHRPKHKDPDCSDWDQHAIQPIWRCIEHVVKLLVRTVEINTSAVKSDEASDGVVQATEAAKFLRARSRGADLMKRHNVSSGTDYEAALENAAARKLMTAAAITIQLLMRARLARKKVAELRAARAKAHESADHDGDGKLNFDEFCAYVRAHEPGEFSDDELRQRFQLLDADGSGEVDMSEYVESKHAAI